MNLSGMYLVGGIFNLLFLVLCIIGYLHITQTTGKKYLFWLFFAIAWLFSLTSYIFLILGSPADSWYITVIRILNYVFHTSTIVSLYVELVKIKS